jgi:diguanylate cyclase (GGDEF)-like protein
LKSKMTIGFKILSLMSVLLLSSVGIFLFLAAQTFLRDKIGFAFELNKNTVTTVASELDASLSNALDKLSTITALNLTGTETQKNLIGQVLEEDPLLVAVSIFEDVKEGTPKLLYSKIQEKFTKQTSLPMEILMAQLEREKPIPFEKLKNKDLVVWNATVSESAPLMALGSKVTFEKVKKSKKETTTEQTTLFAVGYIKTEPFLKLLRGSPLDELYVLDTEGELLIHSNAALQGHRYNFLAVPIVQDFMNKPVATDVKKYNYSGTELLGAFSRTSLGGLGVFSSIESATAFDSVNVLLRRALLFGLIVFFSIVIITHSFAFSLTNPLRRLVDATNKIAGGELDIEVAVHTSDEIGTLALSFNKMTIDLHKSRQELVDINLALEDKVKERTKQLEEMAIKDPLTGAYNRRYFNTRLQEELSRAGRSNSSVGLIYMDIDHFKKYNDTNGHPGGDVLLKQFTQVLQAALRKSDVFARIGGEEFCVISMDTTLDGTAQLAEKLRLAIETTDFPNGDKQPLGRVTCSLGVSAFPSLALDAEALVKSADEALYQVKTQSRNAVGIGVATASDTTQKAG